MLPQGRVAAGGALVRELGKRLAPCIDRDDHHLLEDAGAGRYRAKAMEQLDSIRGAFQNRTWQQHTLGVGVLLASALD